MSFVATLRVTGLMNRRLCLELGRGRGQLDTLLHEGFAVGILIGQLVGADAFGVGAAREHHVVETVDDNEEVAVDELADGLLISV